jgi:hypothetical protein
VAVYAALLGEQGPYQMVVFRQETNTHQANSGNTQATLNFVRGQMNGLLPETAGSFLARNAGSTDLAPDMDLGIPYVLLDQAAFNQLFSINESGWDVFYGRYPQAAGLLTVSRVGFNTSLDQALVYLEILRDFHTGSGAYYLLQKVEGIWNVDQRVSIWSY